MGKSSKDKRDIYYRKAKECGYRARSAFKLLHIDDEFHIFDAPNGERCSLVVDLCAAPGSWSQVIVEKCRHKPDFMCAAVDLQPMSPIAGGGVHQIVGDITQQSTAAAIIAHFGGERADLVVCDGAPDVTGLHDLDEYMQVQLIDAALGITQKILRTGGTFVAKIFRSRECHDLFCMMNMLFTQVHCFKPRSSRLSSAEHFVVGRGFLLPPIGDETATFPSRNAFALEAVVPFVASGGSFDAGAPIGMPDDDAYACADMSYDLGADYRLLQPVQPPIRPSASSPH